MESPASRVSTNAKNKMAPLSKAMYFIDPWILLTSGILILIGLLMVTSASYPNALQNNQSGYYYLIRQILYVTIGLISGLFLFSTSPDKIEKASTYIITIVMILLILVIIPGIGREVNGAMRWLPLGLINVQPAELAKISAIIYVAGYLKRHYQYIGNSIYVLISPLIILSIGGVLLLLQPDFGSTAIILMVSLTMLFMGGVSLIRFGIFVILSLTIMASLVLTSAYRVARLVAFSDPWADPLNKGFQLIQSLIAVGRGEIYGQGIGASIQKLGYLPEAHTDFIFAVYAEETGIIGVIFLVFLFLTFFWRCLYIGYRAYKNQFLFPAYYAYGIGLWFIFQSLINMAVVMGALPTKGLTLPLVSYGGSSIIVMIAAIGFLFRIEIDTRQMNPIPLPIEIIVNSDEVKAKPALRPNRRTPKGWLRWIYWLKRS